MTKNHLKARAAPRTWNIARKGNTFVTRPNPGGQKLDMTLPLGMVLKTLGLGLTKKDINFILRSSEVLVDGRRRWSYNFGVGFMDVVSVPTAQKHAVLTLDTQGRLALEPIDAKHAGQKLSQVRSTGAVKGGKLQLRLSDGRTVLVSKSVPAGSTVSLEIPANKIKSSHALEKGAHVILTSGKHRGHKGTIESMNEEFVIVKTKDGSINTKKSYAFVLGGSA